MKFKRAIVVGYILFTAVIWGGWMMLLGWGMWLLADWAFT